MVNCIDYCTLYMCIYTWIKKLSVYVSYGNHGIELVN